MGFQWQPAGGEGKYILHFDSGKYHTLTFNPLIMHYIYYFKLTLIKLYENVASGHFEGTLQGIFLIWVLVYFSCQKN